MSGLLHKTEDALHLHKHQDSNKSTEQRSHESQEGQGNNSGHNHQSHEKNAHSDHASKDRADFLADREFDHASKSQHGPGVGFEQ